MAKSKSQPKISNTPIVSFEKAMDQLKNSKLANEDVRRDFTLLCRGLTASQEKELLIGLLGHPIMNKSRGAKGKGFYGNELLWDLEKRPTGHMTNSAVKEILDAQSSLDADQRGDAQSLLEAIQAITPADEKRSAAKRKRASSRKNGAPSRASKAKKVSGIDSSKPQRVVSKSKSAISSQR